MTPKIRDAQKTYWECERAMEVVARSLGCTVDEMLDGERDRLPCDINNEISRLLQLQDDMIKITHPHLSNVLFLGF